MKSRSLLLTLLLIFAVALTNTPLAWAGEDSWTIDTSPNQGSSHNQLFGVAAIDSDDATAVGSYYNTTSGYYQPLAMVLDPLYEPQWGLVETPSVSGDSEFYGVTAAPEQEGSDYDLFAVGYQGGNDRDRLTTHESEEHWTAAGATTLIERSTNDGATWSVMTSANHSGATNNILYAVHGVDNENVWAVGYWCCDSGKTQNLIMHWNGSSWSEVSSPSVSGQFNLLLGVYAVADDDVWAVGHNTSNGHSTAILHWDGTVWDDISSPNPGVHNYLFGVTCTASNNCWAVGASLEFNASKETLTLRWNGTSWSTVTSPNGAEGGNVLYGTDDVDSNYVWAVGGAEDPPYQTMTMMWDGTDWEVVSSPNQGSSQYNELRAVSVTPGTSVAAGGTVWAVGFYKNGSNIWQTLILNYTIPD